jgi:hypothetical protein
MKLPIATALILLAAGIGAADAQSLSPMHNSGTTPSDTKGFKLLVGNPYKTKMTFLITPMDTKFRTAAADAAVNFPEITMAPGTTRQVIVTFKIDAVRKERTIGVCVQPKDLEGTILPRVCGTYTGKLLGAAG